MVFIGNQPTAVPLTSDQLTDGLITTAKIADGAVVNVDVNSTAAIAYSKLNLATSIVNADISASAAITLNKLSGNPTFRNRIINGDMSIDQRNAGASVTANDNVFSVDRWKIFATQSSKLTVQQNAGSITPPAGFNYYLGYTSSSAYSITSSDYFVPNQGIEGYNVADLDFGTANAKSITLSFWVRSSLTGTFGGVIRNGSADRNYPFTYTISTSNTWEKKSITIAGDTSGTWNKTNGYGLGVQFGLGVGSTYSGTAGAWSSNTYYSATGATSLVGTSGATWYITGVQLEAGTSATDFEFLPIDVSLGRCQRYYYLHSSRSGNFEPVGVGVYYNSTDLTTFVDFPTNMRADPSLISGSGTDYYAFDRNNGRDYVNSFTLNMSLPTNAVLYNNSQASGTGGDAGFLYLNDNGAYLAFESEL